MNLRIEFDNNMLTIKILPGVFNLLHIFRKLKVRSIYLITNLNFICRRNGYPVSFTD